MIQLNQDSKAKNQHGEPEKEKANLDFGAEAIAIVGGGLVGSLAALFLAQRGVSSVVYEKRKDLRHEQAGGGRSINLAISVRGLHALAQVGLDQEVLRHSIPMKGRMIHARMAAPSSAPRSLSLSRSPSSNAKPGSQTDSSRMSGSDALIEGGEGSRSTEVSFHPYSHRENECIYSLSRAKLNAILMDAAERTGKVQYRFHQRIVSLSCNPATLVSECMDTHVQLSERYPFVIGTDGSNSVIRKSLEEMGCVKTRVELPGYGYKEFTVPPTDRGEFAFFPNALHIWPRGEFMLIALPNLDKSFTCTLFLPEAGAISFRSLSQPGEFRKFFISQFPDLSIYCLEFEKAFQENPVGTLQTVRCSPWNASDQVLLLGDAAHAILPFFGQGMNCGFEDCSVFNCALDETSDRKALFDWISSERKPQADAIADMAIENFVEMRDKVGDPDFLMKRSIEKVLLEKFPDQYVSRYSLVTFSTRSYQEAFQVGQRNELILEELSEALKDLSELDLAKAQRLITAAESRSI